MYRYNRGVKVTKIEFVEMPAKLSQCEIDTKLTALKDRDIEMLSEYQGSSKKHNFRCLKISCGYEWITSWSHVTRVSGCPKCAGKVLDDQYLEVRLLELKNRSIKLLDNFINASVKYNFQCLKSECNYIWKTSWDQITNVKTGCPKCSGRILDENDINDRLKTLLDRSIKSIEPYTNNSRKTKFTCLKADCGRSWVSTWSLVYNKGTGCPRCSGCLVDYNDNIDRLKSLSDRLIEPTEPYIKTHHKTEFHCIKPGCGHRWISTWGSVFNSKSGCPSCSGHFLDDKKVADRLKSLSDRLIAPTEPYISAMCKAEFSCLTDKCRHKWISTWNTIYNIGSGCPRCAGKSLTKQEKELSAYRSRIRLRLSNLFRKGYVSLPVYKDDEYMNNLLIYCKTQMSYIPKKPNDDINWQLDHIIPVTKFDPLDIEQVKLCWDYRNLQWLTKTENCTKSSKLMPEYFTDWHYQVLDTLGLSV